MQRLEQRLQRLEQGRAERLVVVIRSFIGGDLESITRSEQPGHWTREPGEPVDSFRQRAVAGPHLTGSTGVIVLCEHNHREPTRQQSEAMEVPNANP